MPRCHGWQRAASPIGKTDEGEGIMIKKFNIYRKNSGHKNPLPLPFNKWERVRSSAGEGFYPVIRISQEAL